MYKWWTCCACPPGTIPPGTWESTFLSSVQFSDSGGNQIHPPFLHFSSMLVHKEPHMHEYECPSPSSTGTHLLIAFCWPRLELKFAHISSVVQVGKWIWKRPANPWKQRKNSSYGVCGLEGCGVSKKGKAPRGWAEPSKAGSWVGPHCLGPRTVLLPFKSLSDLHNSYQWTSGLKPFTWKTQILYSKVINSIMISVLL